MIFRSSTFSFPPTSAGASAISSPRLTVRVPLCVGGGVLWLACVGLLIVSEPPFLLLLSLCLFVSVTRCLAVRLFLYLSVSLSLCHAVTLSRCLSVSLAVSLSLWLSRCLTASLSRCLVVYLSHCIDSFYLPSVSSSLCFSVLDIPHISFSPFVLRSNCLAAVPTRPA